MLKSAIDRPLGPVATADASGASRPLPPSAAEVLQQLDGLVRRGETGVLTPLASGFQPLDRHLDGGFRPGDLVLVGGAPGVGKTTFTLQMARNVAAQARGACAYVCYEHEESFLLQRLLALESFLAVTREKRGDGMSLSDVRETIQTAAGASANGRTTSLLDVLENNAISATALARLQSFGHRLCLLKASGQEHGMGAMRQLVRGLKERHGSRVALFVDYLQKIPVFPPAPDESEATTRTVGELKDLALAEQIPIVAVVAADREGLRAQRLRMHHLRGSSALAYEADVTLILNNKYRIVAKRSIAFNVYQAQDFRSWVVCTVEKNRSGLDLMELEFRAHFAAAAFDPAGQVVAESLIDERIEE